MIKRMIKYAHLALENSPLCDTCFVQMPQWKLYEGELLHSAKFLFQVPWKHTANDKNIVG